MGNEKENNSRLLTPVDVSEMLSVSVETLNVWRTTRRYPLPYVKVGRLVRYRAADVDSFINRRLQGAPP